ncbi:serine protease [Nocardioides sp. LS1]|nr:serine protease [Nocardioides sp. LS1]
MRMRRFLLASAIAVAAIGMPAAATTVAQAQPTSSTNPWNVTVVRFAPGTTRDQMYAAVKASGGVVTTDLSKIGALAVVSTNGAFRSDVKGNSKVKSVWLDKWISVGEPDSSGAAATTGSPQLGSPGTDPVPDPWHNLSSFAGETNPEGILQWDDNRMNVPAAWATTLGDRTVRVAVVDSGLDGSHKELAANYDGQDSANTIPCNVLTRQFGPGLGEKDCSSGDTEGHGTWVGSRIAGAVNGFASNGVAPNVTVMGFKTLSTTLGGGLTTWIVDGMIRACDADADLINMSIGGYDDPVLNADDYMLWVDAANYCRARGTAIFASAGNEHVRVNRTTWNGLAGVGQVDSGPEGIADIIPGTSVAENDYRGLLEVPAGVPGVVMVSATNNAIAPQPASVDPAIKWPASAVGARDQLTYYSSYGSRVDLAAPGGARKFNIPRYDGGAGDILYGGWGTLGALTANGEICQDPSLASFLTFACFKVNGAAFGWLQGTSMSSPNATGVAALTLAAHPELQGDPNGLLAKLRATARTNMVNLTGPNDPANKADSTTSGPCPTGWCHLDFRHPIRFADAYGAGMVNAGAAVR